MSEKEIIFNALIIGAGRIGATFDEPEDEDVLTHAHAYIKHPNFNLLGFVDADFISAKEAAARWNTAAFKNLDDALSQNKVDVVSVCVPDELHFDFLQRIKEKGILSGILEKPLVHSKEDLDKISSDSFFKNNNFVVNYSRRFVPEYLELRKNILKGQYGQFVSGNCWYGKGFAHNASHIINLLLFFGLDIESSSIFNQTNDFKDYDQSKSVILKTDDDKTITINVINSNLYKVFEIDLFFENSRIRIYNDGFDIDISFIKDDDNFKGYKKLFIDKKIKTDFSKSLYYAVDNLFNILVNKASNLSSVEDAIETQNVIFNSHEQ